MAFQPAYREQVRLRLALMGPSKTGKTFTSIATAASIAYEIRKRGGAGRIAVADSERESVKLYAMSRVERAKHDSMGPDEAYAYIKQLRRFPIDVQVLAPPYTPNSYMEVMQDAAREGYDITILDSISHAWAGSGGLLDRKGKIEDRGTNSFAAWRTITPEHDAFVDAMLTTPTHLIVTMRMKTTHAVQTDEKGKTKIVELGMEEIQRDGIKYEFTLLGKMDHDHVLTVVGSRLDGVITAGDTFAHPGEAFGRKIYGWVNDGDEPAPPVAKPVPRASAPVVQHTGKDADRRAEFAQLMDESGAADKLHAIEIAASIEELTTLLPDLAKLGNDVPSLKPEIRKRYDERKRMIQRETEKFAAAMTAPSNDAAPYADVVSRCEQTGTMCSVCDSPQVYAPNGGVTCKFGHGGADPKTA